MLQNLIPYTGTYHITLDNMHQTKIANEGQGVLPTPNQKLYLSHINHAPKLSHNLLSIHQST